MNKDIKVLSLFAGAGGLDIGFIKAGFNILTSVELEEKFCKTLNVNKGTYFSENHITICADITQLEPNQIDYNEFDFIIGGPPCQSFSAAGRRAGGVYGVNDLRGSLFWHYCRLIEHYQPKGFLFENVRGLLQANNKTDWEIIKNSFEELGYTLSYRVLDAADYGVPQHRERVIVVGIKNQVFKFPRPTHGPDSVDNTPYISAGEALSDIDNPNEIVPPYGGKYGDLLMEIPPGMNYSYFTEKMGHPNPIFAWRSKFSDFLYKADPSVPCKTIVASQGKYGGPFHWRGRKFTMQELKRLQSFPDDYQIVGSDIIVAKQIGNSVAPKFAEIIAKAVMKQVFNPSSFPEIMEIDEDFKLSFDSRKGKKAKSTQAVVVPNRKSNFEQLDLFGENSIIFKDYQEVNRIWLYKEPRKRHEINSEQDLLLELKESDGYGGYTVNGTLNEGQWLLSVCKKNLDIERVKNISLCLDFHSPVSNKFKTIKCTIETDTLLDVCVAWDAIDECIRLSTSYDNIHPLYGHFTEPYPKFNLSVEVKGNDVSHEKMEAFLVKVSDINFLSKIHPFKELTDIFDIDESQVINIIKMLRGVGFDIRVNQTNRTIPHGYFRCCYPFTISLNKITNVTWKELGEHKTADQTSIPVDILGK